MTITISSSGAQKAAPAEEYIIALNRVVLKGNASAIFSPGSCKA